MHHQWTEMPKSTFQVSDSSSSNGTGYGGYIPGVKSENVFGQTYGKVTYQSSAGAIPRGIDQPSNLKYQSMFKAEYIQHSKHQYETTADIVGVQRQEDSFKKV